MFCYCVNFFVVIQLLEGRYFLIYVTVKWGGFLTYIFSQKSYLSLLLKISEIAYSKFKSNTYIFLLYTKNSNKISTKITNLNFPEIIIKTQAFNIKIFRSSQSFSCICTIRYIKKYLYYPLGRFFLYLDSS